MAKNTYKQDEILEEPFDIRHLLRASSYIKKYRRGMILAIVLSGIGGAFGYVAPMIIQRALDIAVPDKNMRLLFSLVATLIAIYVVSVIFTTIRSRIMVDVSQNIIYDIRKDLFEHLQELPFQYYEAVVSADTGCDDSVEDLFSQIAKARREDLTFCQNLLEKNPKLASQSPKPDAALKEENAMLSRLQKEILTDFPAPPQTEVEICHVDPALSEYLAPAFYITAPIDDISHNRIYINDAKNDTDIYYFTTLAHEGYPGHLYQTICTSSYGAPEVLSLLNYPGYTEGWATYTEMQSFYYAGLDPDLASLLQHNQAATLSLYATADIGIHYFGWEKEKNAAFWSEYGVDDTATVKRITDLILEEPGNYLKYYVGYLKFRQMREQLALENKSFSVSAFHEAILRTGPSPFSVLEETVRDQLK